jgi:adenylate kinase
MTTIVLLGAPASGKGTQAKLLEAQLGVPHLASGDLLRAAVAARTAVGVEADRYMSRGQLVPDGFPRTRPQAEALDEALAERGSRVDQALLIDVPLEDLVRRAAGRRICQASGHVYHVISNPPRVPGRCDIDGSALIQRDDDREEVVRARMAQQLGALRDVVGYYRSNGVLRTVDGRQPIEDVTAALLASLDGAPTGAA